MKIPFTPPTYRSTNFNCPHCNAFTHMQWSNVFEQRRSYIKIEKLNIAFCTRCSEYSLWENEKMLFPKAVDVENPNDDLTEEIKNDYKEASYILQDSPRSAAALLRLSIEKLVNELGAEGRDLNEKIQWIVDNKGLSTQIQKSLDILRVIGNNSVHPGEINLNDNPQIANALFKLINLIAEKTITEPKEIDSLYSTLPESALKGIEKRSEKKQEVKNE